MLQGQALSDVLQHFLYHLQNALSIHNTSDFDMPLKTGFYRFLQMNNSAIEHNTTKLITSHNQMYIQMILITHYCKNLSEIGENPLL